MFRKLFSKECLALDVSIVYFPPSLLLQIFVKRTETLTDT